MDYYKIKAEAEAIRDAAGLPAGLFPVRVRIEDVAAHNTGPAYGRPYEFHPWCDILLGLNCDYGPAQSEVSAMIIFKERVSRAAYDMAREARRANIQLRWSQRRTRRALFGK